MAVAKLVANLEVFAFGERGAARTSLGMMSGNEHTIDGTTGGHGSCHHEANEFTARVRHGSCYTTTQPVTVSITFVREHCAGWSGKCL